MGTGMHPARPKDKTMKYHYLPIMSKVPVFTAVTTKTGEMIPVGAAVLVEDGAELYEGKLAEVSIVNEQILYRVVSLQANKVFRITDGSKITRA
jgi:hypothetical protein